MGRRPILLLCAACVAWTARADRTADASPRSDPTTGRAVFTGAATASPTSITLNPAALGTGPIDEIYLAFAAVLDQIDITPSSLDPATGALTAGDPVSTNQLGPGGMIAFVWHVGERGTLGFEARTPPPEQFPSGLAGERLDRVGTLAYHTRGLRQRDFLATIGGAFRVASMFYFGASLAHDNTFLRLRYARDTALEQGLDADCGGAPCGLANPLAAQLYDVDVRSDRIGTTNVRVNVGIVARLLPGVWLGLAYHTPPGFDIQSRLGGTMNVNLAPREGGELVVGRSTVYVQFPASVDGELRMELPRLLELHVGGRWEDLSRMQAYDVRGYGESFLGTPVPEWVERPRGFHDGFALWAGIEQLDVGEQQRWRFGGRFGLERSSLPDDRTSPLSIAPLSVTFDGGAQLRVSPGWSLQLSYGVQLFKSVKVTDSAYDPRDQVRCAASGFDYATEACANVRNGFAIPTAAGDYSRIQHALRLGLRYELPP